MLALKKVIAPPIFHMDHTAQIHVLGIVSIAYAKEKQQKNKCLREARGKMHLFACRKVSQEKQQSSREAREKILVDI